MRRVKNHRVRNPWQQAEHEAEVQSRLIEKEISSRCKSWDREANHLRVPEENLLVAVIARAIADLRFTVFDPERDNGIGADAHGFLFSERLEDFTDWLDVDPDWIREACRRWLQKLHQAADEARALTVQTTGKPNARRKAA